MPEDLEAKKTATFRSDWSDRLREEGFLDGFEEGQLRVARSTLIKFLELTPGGITAQHRRRIEASTDRRALDDWIKVIIQLRSQIPSAGE
jgi:hypothetical protein